ncbi:TetR/AcrR family transcriptional regulator [Nocardia sp. NPDC088792]|uniref:TetR/AcrR family transcriptional regulator n=1 Tax=Nocardia sp. NPDC088792 TaxID=3364332 RepID=UPI00382DD810
MPRWEPNARERLMRAALTLFVERGYENTTVIDIVERAGLGKTTFFRYFRDKREVLFGGDSRPDLLATEIASAPPSATPLEAIAAALTAAGRERFTPERREILALRQSVIDANPELREREALKNLTLITSMTEALEARGVPGLTSAVTAQLGGLTIEIAFKRWIAATDTEDFADLVGRTLTEVQVAAVQ